MKLFGNNKEENVEEAISEQIPEEMKEDTAAADETANHFVMDIEGLEFSAEEEPAATLRGVTKTLPGHEQIEEAMEAAEAAVADTEKAAADTAEEAINTVEDATSEIAEETINTVEDAASEIAEEAANAAEEAVEAIPVPEPISAPEPVKESEPEEKLSSVSYASVAQAVVNAKKEPTGRYDRDAVDDETLLAELYALIGDKNTKKTAASPVAEAPAPVQTRPAPRPVARITPEALQDAPEEFIEVEEDTSGIPGWLKGAFILLISLLLSAMTFYAVASDVIGKIF